MAAHVDPRLVTAAHADRTYLHDRACAGCGYNLRGLVMETACPECGMIARVPKDIDAPLSAMPLPMIRRFSWASLGALVACVAVVAYCIAPLIHLQARASEVVLLAGTIVWVAATFWLTPSLESSQARFHGFTERNPVRHLARWLQFGWLAAIVFSLYLPIVPTAVVVLCALIGLAGTVCTCLILQELAEWARDTTAETALNHAMWGVPLGLIAVNVVGVVSVGPLVVLSAGVVGLYGVITLSYGVFSLSRSLAYSVDHAKEAVDVDKRRAERRRQWQNERGASVDRADAARDERGTTI